MHLIIECVELFQIDFNDGVINRLAIKKSHKNICSCISVEIKLAFNKLNITFEIVHYKSELFSNLKGTEIVNRLPIVTSASNTEQLLVLQLPSGYGNKVFLLFFTRYYFEI